MPDPALYGETRLGEGERAPLPGLGLWIAYNDHHAEAVLEALLDRFEDIGRSRPAVWCNSGTPCTEVARWVKLQSESAGAQQGYFGLNKSKKTGCPVTAEGADTVIVINADALRACLHVKAGQPTMAEKIAKQVERQVLRPICEAVG